MKYIFKNKKLLIPLAIALLVNLVTWVLLAWRLLGAEPEVTLHYTIYFGVDRLGPAWQALYVPAVGLLLLIINAWLAARVKQRDTVALALAYLTLFIEALILVAGTLLVLVNI